MFSLATRTVSDSGKLANPGEFYSTVCQQLPRLACFPSPSVQYVWGQKKNSKYYRDDGGAVLRAGKVIASAIHLPRSTVIRGGELAIQLSDMLGRNTAREGLCGLQGKARATCMGSQPPTVYAPCEHAILCASVASTSSQ